MTDQSFLTRVACDLEGLDWVLVGGTMTELHCQHVGVSYERPTSDIDIVVDPSDGTSMLAVASRLESKGYAKQTPLDPKGAIHRFVASDGVHVDVMGKDSDLTPDKWFGYKTIKCPGSKSALGKLSSGEPKELWEFELEDGNTIRIPNIWSSIALKGRAFRQSGANLERHVQDAIALFACAGVGYDVRELTKSEREAFNFILSSSALGEFSNWMFLDNSLFGEAKKAMLSVRPAGDFVVPEGVE